MRVLIIQATLHKKSPIPHATTDITTRLSRLNRFTQYIGLANRLLHNVDVAGYSRFAATFVERGWGDVGDVQTQRLTPQELIDVMREAGALRPQIARVRAALLVIGGLYYDAPAAREGDDGGASHMRGPVEWLDSIKHGYGPRFAAAFAYSGYEDVDDLKVCKHHKTHILPPTPV